MDLTSFFQSTLIPDMKKEEPKKPEKNRAQKKKAKKAQNLSGTGCR